MDWRRFRVYLREKYGVSKALLGANGKSQARQRIVPELGDAIIEVLRAMSSPLGRGNVSPAVEPIPVQRKTDNLGTRLHRKGLSWTRPLPGVGRVLPAQAKATGFKDT